MKLQSVLYYCSFLAVVKAQYSSICPDRDGETEEINPGHFVKYKCGWLGPYGGATHQNINTAQACAQLCQDKPGCTGSSWQSVQSRCVLSGDRTNEARSNVLWMEVVQPEEDPFPEDPEEEVVDPFPENPEEDCDTQLGTCQTQNTDCLTEKAALQHEKAAWIKKQNALSKCPSQHEKVIVRGGIRYKVHCFMRSKGFTGYKSTDHAFTQCMDACSADSRCKAIHYLIDSAQPCKMLGSVDNNKQPDHSSSPQISLIPVTPK